MINLLPAETKQAYRYARLNRNLLRWITACAFGILGALIITAVGYLYLNQSAKSYEKQVASINKQLAAQNLSGVQNQVKDISNNLRLAVDVLSKQVVFSDVLGQLTTLMPVNTNLTGLSVAQSQGAIDITATAKSSRDATQVQVNLSDPNNQLFSKADVVSLNCNGNTDYPCTIILRALFAPDNPYMFSSTSQGAGS